MTWKLKEGLRAHLSRERGTIAPREGAKTRFALAYPNSYFVGMSNLGFQIIYEILNRRARTSCERFFLPERHERAEYVRAGVTLMSVDTQSPLTDFDVVGFAVSFELDYWGVIEMLRLGHLPPLASDRDAHTPFVIAGGPCATFNPEPLSPFVDAFVIGEGEETVPHFMDAYEAARDAGATREEALLAFAKISGVYVPSLYTHKYDDDGTLREISPRGGAPERVKRQWVKNIDMFPAHTAISTPDTEFGFHLIETARGCGRHCRFCMAGYAFRKPRSRSLGALKDEIVRVKDSAEKIGLMGAAISDYPDIDELSEIIMKAGLRMTVASFRADSVTEKLVSALAKSGTRTLTLAPEAGSERLRSVINKGITEEHLFHAAMMGKAAGIRHYRLYMMVGLPYEDMTDIEAMASLARRFYEYLTEGLKNPLLTLSVNPFVPKPFTPFQWLPMAGTKYIDGAVKFLRKALSGVRGIEILSEPSKSSAVQGVLARGDRRVGMAVYDAGRAGNLFRALRQSGADESFYLYRDREEHELFPWDTIDIGVKREYLYLELCRAKNFEKTPPCSDGCRRCGVC